MTTDALAHYRGEREFSKTAEPKGGRSGRADAASAATAGGRRSDLDVGRWTMKTVTDRLDSDPWQDALPRGRSLAPARRRPAALGDGGG